MFERSAGSHSLAAATQRERWQKNPMKGFIIGAGFTKEIREIRVRELFPSRNSENLRAVAAFRY